MTTLINTTTREAVVAELEWDPQVDPQRIGVSANDGVVVLSGHVSSYPDRWAAVKAAQRVYGVTVVVDGIEVRLRASSRRDDVDIADDIARHIRSSSEIADTVRAEVLGGHVTLSGEVGRSYERADAERAILHLSGVQGVNNTISVRPDRPQIADIERRVREAMVRVADIDARGIRITATEGTIHLHGAVHTYAEKQAAEFSAASAPGVSFVDNEIVVAP
jgi:osmotically-inducible protein OsmY